MKFTSDTDAKLSDQFLDISKSETRLVRITGKKYEKTGAYFFIKLFKKNEAGEFVIHQRLTLTHSEFEQFRCKGDEVSALVKQKNGGSNVWEISRLFQAIPKFNFLLY